MKLLIAKRTADLLNLAQGARERGGEKRAQLYEDQANKLMEKYGPLPDLNPIPTTLGRGTEGSFLQPQNLATGRYRDLTSMPFFFNERLTLTTLHHAERSFVLPSRSDIEDIKKSLKEALEEAVSEVSTQDDPHGNRDHELEHEDQDIGDEQVANNR